MGNNMEDHNNFKRNVKKHIAFNEFEKAHRTGTIFNIDASICSCKQWKVGASKCVCGSTRIYLDYSETTNTIFPVKIPTDLSH